MPMTKRRQSSSQRSGGMTPIVVLLQVTLLSAAQLPSSPAPSSLQLLPLRATLPRAPIETTTPISPSNSTTAKPISTAEEHPTCFYQPAPACANIAEHKKCKSVRLSPDSVLCCNLDSVAAIKKGLKGTNVALKDIKQLHLRNVTAKALDLGSDPFSELVSLEHLAITDGSVHNLQGRLRSSQLSCLNVSSNALTQLPTLNITVEHLLLDISGNNGMFCASIQDFMNQFRQSKKKTTELEFAHNANSYYCLLSQIYNWFNSTERVSLAQVAALNSLDEDCPSFPSGACRCEPAMIDMRAGGSPTMSVKVDCSGCGLTELPPRLPPHTISLNVSNNRIWNLTALSLNPDYSEIRLFLADNNTIASIDILEGSHFIQNFVELSLRSNNISALPIYILSNGFDRSSETQILNLGQNRLKCDCSTAQTVKIWLVNHKKNIQDYLEVLCANQPERVSDLDQNKICAVQSDWTDYIYYIIAGEVALLVLLIAKVSYDYWVFKTAGYLPWPASKMPKLPCDWVFE